MRTIKEIVDEIIEKLKENECIYEIRSLENELKQNCSSTEVIAGFGSVIEKMMENKKAKQAIGSLVDEYRNTSVEMGISYSKSTTYSLNQKVFVIDGDKINNYEDFMEYIGTLLVENNEWGHNWNALNDILSGGFVITDYDEPIILVWKNHIRSKNVVSYFEDIVKLISEHENIELRLE